jgi:hypothetical protein
LAIRKVQEEFKEEDTLCGDPSSVVPNAIALGSTLADGKVSMADANVIFMMPVWEGGQAKTEETPPQSPNRLFVKIVGLADVDFEEGKDKDEEEGQPQVDSQ